MLPGENRIFSLNEIESANFLKILKWSDRLSSNAGNLDKSQYDSTNLFHVVSPSVYAGDKNRRLKNFAPFRVLFIRIIKGRKRPQFFIFYFSIDPSLKAGANSFVYTFGLLGLRLILKDLLAQQFFGNPSPRPLCDASQYSEFPTG